MEGIELALDGEAAEAAAAAAAAAVDEGCGSACEVRIEVIGGADGGGGEE